MSSAIISNTSRSNCKMGCQRSTYQYHVSTIKTEASQDWRSSSTTRGSGEYGVHRSNANVITSHHSVQADALRSTSFDNCPIGYVQIQLSRSFGMLVLRLPNSLGSFSACESPTTVCFVCCFVNLSCLWYEASKHSPRYRAATRSATAVAGRRTGVSHKLRSTKISEVELRVHEDSPCRPAALETVTTHRSYITFTCKELKEQRYHKSNSFNFYANALLPKMRRPIYINNWCTHAARKVVTCHGGDELDMWRAAQVELDEL
eukprot:6179079-Pleurochrysis_carterae.AAC.1